MHKCDFAVLQLKMSPIALILVLSTYATVALSSEQCYGTNSGVDYSPGSNDIRSQGNIELGACCDLCKYEPRCKAYVWSKFWRKCWLKSATSPLKFDADRISGFSDSTMGNAQQQCSAVDSGLDISPGSNDITSMKTDLATCCSSCNSNPSCKAFVWSKGSSTCWLKSADYPRVKSGDRVSGLRGGGFNPPPIVPPVVVPTPEPEPTPTPPVQPSSNCGTDSDIDNSGAPYMACYDQCAKGDAAGCACCQTNGFKGGKCLNKVPYCFK